LFIYICWYFIAIEEASRHWFGHHNAEAMLSTLQPLHYMLEQGPQTLHEVHFQQTYGRELLDAHEWCEKYSKSKNVSYLDKAWALLSACFR
jgi:FKBP12-rapamycin complex-associated protein